MRVATKGKVIINRIPDDPIREKVVAFICTHAGNAQPEAVRRRLEVLPATIAMSVDAAKGEHLTAALCALGAATVFIADIADPPQPMSPPSAMPMAGTPPPEAPHMERPVRQKNAVAGTARKKSPVPPDELKRISEAKGAQLTLAFALLAVLISMYSPIFYIFAIPLALYATHQAVGLLEEDIWFRGMYLAGMFVPFVSVIILTMLLVRVRIFLSRSRPLPVTHDESLMQPVWFACRAVYAILMVLFVVGAASGVLPASSEGLRETVERRLQREVARSAKEFPRKVDKDLRIDSVTCGPARRLTFHCTLLNHQGKSIDADAFKRNINGKMVEDVCYNKETRYYLNKDVVISYAFNGNDGEPITTIDVMSTDCKK